MAIILPFSDFPFPKGIVTHLTKKVKGQLSTKFEPREVPGACVKYVTYLSTVVGWSAAVDGLLDPRIH